MMVSRNCVAIGFAATADRMCRRKRCAGRGTAPAPAANAPPCAPGPDRALRRSHACGRGCRRTPPTGWQPVARHGETRVSRGSIRDGVGAAELTAYLQADAASYLGLGEADGTDVQLLPDGLVFRFAAIPPTVRVAESTPPELVDETVRVVQAINAALPAAWQIGFDPEPTPGGATDPVDGEILVTFARQADWPPEAAPPGEQDVGLADPRSAIVPTGDPAVTMEARHRRRADLGRPWANRGAGEAGRHRARTHSPARSQPCGLRPLPGHADGLGRARGIVRAHSPPPRPRGTARGVRPPPPRDLAKPCHGGDRPLVRQLDARKRRDRRLQAAGPYSAPR